MLWESGCSGQLERVGHPAPQAGDSNSTRVTQTGTEDNSEKPTSSGTDGAEVSFPRLDDPPAVGRCSEPTRDPGPTFARRLTRPEYVQTVRDVLGVDVNMYAGQVWPRDLQTEGFYNTAKDLLPTLERVDGFRLLANRVVDEIDDFDGFAANFADCDKRQTACIRTYVQRLGKRLARRPLLVTEVDSYARLFDVASACGGSFRDGAQAVLRGMLQGPQFLYRSERQRVSGDGEARALDGFEIASRLSYLVTGSAPDDGLLARAETGDLSDPEVRAVQVRRLFQTEAGRETARRFIRDWLTLDELDFTQRDAEDFPEWNNSFRAEMKAEVMRMVEREILDGGQPLAVATDSPGDAGEPCIGRTLWSGGQRERGPYV